MQKLYVLGISLLIGEIYCPAKCSVVVIVIR